MLGLQGCNPLTLLRLRAHTETAHNAVASWFAGLGHSYGVTMSVYGVMRVSWTSPDACWHLRRRYPGLRFLVAIDHSFQNLYFRILARRALRSYADLVAERRSTVNNI